MGYSTHYSYGTKYATSKKVWDASETLEIVNPAVGRVTCTGHAPSKGRRCQIAINISNRSYVDDVLDEISYLNPSDPAVMKRLRSIVSNTLCVRYHQSQDDSILSSWTRKIEEQKRRIVKEKKNRLAHIAFLKVEIARLEEEERKAKLEEAERDAEASSSNESNEYISSDEGHSSSGEDEEENYKEKLRTRLRQDEERKRREREEQEREAKRREKARLEKERTKKERLEKERLEQERLERERKEREERKKREEERAKREQERLDREERIRQNALRSEQLRKDQERKRREEWERLWTTYEENWTKFRESSDTRGVVTLKDAIPWPVKSGAYRDVMAGEVTEFFNRAAPKDIPMEKVMRKECVKWHPDCRNRWLGGSVLSDADQLMVEMICRVVTELLNASQGRSAANF